MNKAAFAFRILVVSALGGALSANPRPAGAVALTCRVDLAAPAGGDGQSWATAYNNLTLALQAPSCADIWVKAGVYKPTTLANRTTSFTIHNGVAVYGGFDGTEDNPIDRNPTAHVTILSGDIDNNDANHETTNIDVTWNDIAGANSYHVVYMNTVSSGTTLDGFTITGGQADGGGSSNQGGGLLCIATGGGTCSPTLRNLRFSGNLAGNGGAIYNNGSSTGNSSPSLTNMIISGNQAVGYGGGIYNNGTSGTSSPVLTNVSFSGNYAGTAGGALMNHGTGGVSMPGLVNAILWGDTTGGSASTAEIYNLTAIPNISYSLIEGSGGSGAGWQSALGTDGGGNLDSEPYYADPAHGVLQVQANSPSIDAGNSTASGLTGITTDILGEDRFVDAPWAANTGTGAEPVDMGAVEYQFSCPPGAVMYVDVNAAGDQNGSSWADAYLSIPQALNILEYCPAVEEVWVAAGVYLPGMYREDYISIQPGMELYGGFAGNETERAQRDPGKNVTILTGDIDGDDDGSNADGNFIAESAAEIAGENLYHVVVMGAGSTSDTVLDGFAITGGLANGVDGDDRGGGLYCDGSGGAICSPTLRNLTFSGNAAEQLGGGLYNDGFGGTSNPTLENITFVGNSAAQGGALFNDGDDGVSSPMLTNVTFSGNTATDDGGAMYNLGAGAPTMTNVTFNGNTATHRGGGIFNDGSQGTVNATLTNVILWGDTASDGNEIYSYLAGANITYGVVQGMCGLSGPTCYTGIVDADPKLGPLTDNGGLTRTQALHAGSAAIDAGLACASTDQRGISRPRGEGCDIGAYERIPPPVDFDGDTGSDLGYFRASSGLWAMLHSGDGFSYGAPQFHTWGQAGDIVVPGDYDGDGMIDPTIRRPPASGQSAAYMALLSSTDYDFGSPLIVPAGWPGLGDTPVPADYNGDGITDPAIFRGNTGVWIIPLSPTFTTPQFASWGMSGDKPVGADVDGDGIADIGYFRPSTGVWGFLLSTYGYSYGSPLFFSWGNSTATPVMRDYDGDGFADPAYVTPPTGGQSAAYRILPSGTGYDFGQSWTIPAGWPGLGDTPVPADYDGDGKADAGIWRGNSGVWIIPKSSTNNSVYMYAAWGASGDQVLK